MSLTRIARLTLAGLTPLALMAQEPPKAEELARQLQELKALVSALETKAKEQEAIVTKVETKVAQNGINWGGDLRTKVESSTWTFKPYQQFMGFVPNPGPGPMTGMPMPVAQQVDGQDWKNDAQWSTRLRLRMNIPVSEHGKIMGRLTMYKVHGGADVPVFNGSPNTVSSSFNSGKVPTNDVLHVERASFVYDWTQVGVLSIGRQNTSDGPPFEVREGTERQATPQALAVNATVDGLGFKFHLDQLGLPEGSLLGLCYGVGYESGFGGGGQVKRNAAVVGMNFSTGNLQVNTIGPLKDSTVLGAMLDIPFMFEGFGTVHAANVYLGFNRFGNMTDIPYGSLNNFPVPAMAGMGGMASSQYVTATANVGDMDQWTATYKHKVGDTFTWFASFGHIKSNPNGKVSQYGAYWDMPPAYGGAGTQLTGFGGLLGDPIHSKTGSAYYLGWRWDPTPTFGFGVEFNHGSPNWFTYSPATGESTEKLGTRGDVWEGYLHWQFAKNTSLKLGYLDTKYSTAFSGWHIAPMPLENFKLDQNPMMQYAFPAAIKTTYLALEVKF
ncbi:MAG TPA: DUF3373 family protein [Holophagaceae bacterium]|nr:DUF3373 family protein [Holophagaceae bacterium]